MNTQAAYIIDNFDDFNLSEDVLESIRDVGYQTPTIVQSAAIPLVLAGIDLIVQSQTGTGKTAAFVIPIIEMLTKKPQVQVLVLTPTRELAKQVCGEFERIASHKGIHATAIYGGTAFEPQIKALKTAQVIAATPGRLLDLLRNNHLTLDHLEFFILDEADEMMSMGFEKELDAIIEQLPERRQCLLFSATVTEAIKSLAAHFLTTPEYLNLSSDSVASRKVEHIYYLIEGGTSRLRDLLRVIEYNQPETALIFCNTRNDTQTVTSFLTKNGYKARVINGDLPQKEREKALQAVKEDRIQFLVATDVAARGIDISALPVVINYALPEHAEVYIHRTGRTGRAGQSGVAYSLMSPLEIGTYYQLVRVYHVDLNEQTLPTREDIIAAAERRRLGSLLDTVDETPEARIYSPFLGLAERLLDRDDAPQAIAKLLALAQQAPAAAPAAPTPISVDAAEDETEEEEEATADASSKDDDTVEAEAKPKAKTSSKRASKGSDASDDEDEEDEGRGGRRRRRSRRRSRRDDEAQAAPQAEEAPAEEQPAEAEKPAPVEASSPDEDEEERPRRRRRSRRRSSSKDDRRKSKSSKKSKRDDASEEEDDDASSRKSSKSNKKSKRDEDSDGDDRRGERRSRRSRRSRDDDDSSSDDRRGRRSRRDSSDDEDGNRRGGSGRRSSRRDDDSESRDGRRSSRRRRSEERSEEAPARAQSSSRKEEEPAKSTNGHDKRTVWLNVGSDALDASVIPTLFCELAGLFPEDLGSVEVSDDHSLVEVRADFAEDVIEAIDGQPSRGLTVRAQLQDARVS